MSARTLAMVFAVGCAYVAVGAIVTDRMNFVGPCAAGFAVCMYCAQLLSA